MGIGKKQFSQINTSFNSSFSAMTVVVLLALLPVQQADARIGCREAIVRIGLLCAAATNMIYSNIYAPYPRGAADPYGDIELGGPDSLGAAEQMSAAADAAHAALQHSYNLVNSAWLLSGALFATGTSMAFYGHLEGEPYAVTAAAGLISAPLRSLATTRGARYKASTAYNAFAVIGGNNLGFAASSYIPSLAAGTFLTSGLPTMIGVNAISAAVVFADRKILFGGLGPAKARAEGWGYAGNAAVRLAVAQVLVPYTALVTASGFAGGLAGEAVSTLFSGNNFNPWSPRVQAFTVAGFVFPASFFEIPALPSQSITQTFHFANRHNSAIMHTAAAGVFMAWYNSPAGIAPNITMASNTTMAPTNATYPFGPPGISGPICKQNVSIPPFCP